MYFSTLSYLRMEVFRDGSGILAIPPNLDTLRDISALMGCQWGWLALSKRGKQSGDIEQEPARASNVKNAVQAMEIGRIDVTGMRGS